MRFRYADADGNDVTLSTTAELAEKIAVGEVTADTRLYDAACDRWAPAREQEIYRHIVESETDGPVDADDAAGEAPAGPGGATGDPADDPAGESAHRPTAPPLEDFWGPAMSVTASEGSGGSEGDDEVEGGSFDLSLESLEAEAAEHTPRESAAPSPTPRPRKRPSPASPGATDLADAESDPSSAGSDQSSTEIESPPAASDGPSAAPPDRVAAASDADLDGPEPADIPLVPLESDPGGPAPGRPGRSRSRRQQGDPSLRELKAIARQAVEKMEREEAERTRGRGPSLADRVGARARAGGRRTGEALRSGASASARLISEGGRITAGSLESGARTLRSGIRSGLRGLLARGGNAVSAATRAFARGAAAIAGRAVGLGRRASGRGATAAVGVVTLARRAVLLPLHLTVRIGRVIGASARWTARRVRGVAGIPGRALTGSAAALAGAARSMAGFGKATLEAVFSPAVLGVAGVGAVLLLFTHGPALEPAVELWEGGTDAARTMATASGRAAGDLVDRAREQVAREPEAREQVTRGPAENASAGDSRSLLAASPDPAASAGREGEDEAAAPDGGADRPVAAREGPGGAPAPVPGPPYGEDPLAGYEEEVSVASEAALGDLISAMDSIGRHFALPPEPPEEWLGGYYLSNAGEFEGVRQYWAGYRGYIRTVKAQDTRLFREALQARLGEAGIPAARIPGVTEVVATRFRNAGVRRDSVYDAMAAVAEAAVDLHDFLVERTREIEYDPVISDRISRAPVLEAYPVTPELRAAFNARLDRVLERMARVQSLRPVRTEDLQEGLFEGLRALTAVDTFQLGRQGGAADPGGR